MLEKALSFIEKLPSYLVKPAGNIDYTTFALSLPVKQKKGAFIIKLLIILGVILFIVRRFRKK